MQSMRLRIAKILLRETLFDGDIASAETIWRSQRPEVRESWLRRADKTIAAFDEFGLEIRDLEGEGPNYDADHR